MVEDRNPERVLLLSADMGEGHNAAARALRETMHRLWPDCEIKQVDTIELRGRHFAKLCRSAYRFQISQTPRIYQFFYDALIKHPWFTRVSKMITGSFFGRPLDRVIRRFRPDCVVSTYPLGSSALHWLRRTRGLAGPTATFVTDFAVHPFWVYSSLDLHVLLHEAGIIDAQAAGAKGAVLVGAPPVRDDFGPRSQIRHRSDTGLPPQAFVVLVTGGAWGVGSMELAVRALVRLEAPVHVVAVCGRNEQLRADLEALSSPRLSVLGYVETMPQLMAAADVVITNGAGATVLEALASSRPVVVFDPIAGHGRASADLMERVGLALVCQTVPALERTISRLASDRFFLGTMRTAEKDYLAGKELRRDVKTILATPTRAVPRWRRPAWTAVRAAAAATVVVVTFTHLSFMAGSRLAHAARGGAPGTRTVAIAVTGSLSPSVLSALDAGSSAEGIPVTFFLQGQDAAAAPDLAASMAAHGIEVETGMWRSCRDNALEPGDTRAEFTNSVAAVTTATGHRPRYAAEPCGSFSLFAVEVTNDLHLRRVLFSKRIAISDDRLPSIRSVPTRGIIEVLVLPGASPEGTVTLLRALADAAAGQGVKLVTVAELDQAAVLARPFPRAELHWPWKRLA